MTKNVYSFGGGKAEGSVELKNLLGGKGANLAEMSSLGIDVPPGFTITTEICNHYTSHDSAYPDDLAAEVDVAMAQMEEIMGQPFGSGDNPMLVSVRSGARASMPGMMDTVLNLGLNDETVVALAKASGDERFAYDSYRRFIQMYSDVVLGVDHAYFEDILDDTKLRLGVSMDTALSADDWKDIIAQYKREVEKETGKPFPQHPREQLWGSISSVFESWMNNRAIVYRKLHNIPQSWGTAVNVQAMVFGNMGEDCATGVCFTRNPATGENLFYGEFLVNAQGEDVVAGIRTPQPLTKEDKIAQNSRMLSFEEAMPDVYVELCKVREVLESHYKDMQDMEFTVQKGRLWMLQTRAGKRTAKASLGIALDMQKEGLLNKQEAIMQINPHQLDQLLHPMLDPDAEREILATGLPASPGAAVGRIVFSSKDAELWVANKEKVILVRTETSPEDISGMYVAEGVLTSRGGMTSHAAVVARGMGKPCVSGAGDIHVDYNNKTMKVLGSVYNEGDTITLDGTSGEIISGSVPMVQPELTGAFAELMEWVDEIRTMGVRANAETPLDAKTARKFGAEGIGLSRTEHMFFDPERIVHMREMILAKDLEARKVALDKLLPYQRKDFTELFEIMEGLPVTIRLLDPPLHEFIPHGESEVTAVAEAAGIKVADVKARAEELHEVNPMLGHRGSRLGLTYPEIYEMQARAIFEAASDITIKGGTVEPEVMIPLVVNLREFEFFKVLVDKIADQVKAETGASFKYLVGTMIELPRACLRAGEIAKSAEFFSFGTNDLTQTTFGYSRDDAGSFLDDYYANGILTNDPFVTIDQDGVGELVILAKQRGDETRPGMKMGICGEHGGDPDSVEFCHRIGLTYVSCSPYRVPIARLSAAQAVLKQG
ncbi:MAG: pyruvate, phosphate dikinase [Rhodospirillales bacterium]|nr:pyruvate, phosphate dikinase [Rhodospirillales bacterium]